MTLKEKFSNVQDAYHDRSDECEKIAEDFAIGFAEWYLNLWHTDDDSSFDNNSPQELLQIYKKTL
jgi:hypothetical protein